MFPQYTVPVHLQADLFPRELTLAQLTLPEPPRPKKRPLSAPLSAAPATPSAAPKKAARATLPVSRQPKSASGRHVVVSGLRDELRSSIVNTLRLVRKVMRSEEIADACDCSKRRAESLLRELIAQGEVRLAIEPDGYIANPVAKALH